MNGFSPTLTLTRVKGLDRTVDDVEPALPAPLLQPPVPDNGVVGVDVQRAEEASAARVGADGGEVVRDGLQRREHLGTAVADVSAQLRGHLFIEK